MFLGAEEEGGTVKVKTPGTYQPIRLVWVRLECGKKMCADCYLLEKGGYCRGYGNRLSGNGLGKWYRSEICFAHDYEIWEPGRSYDHLILRYGEEPVEEEPVIRMGKITWGRVDSDFIECMYVDGHYVGEVVRLVRPHGYVMGDRGLLGRWGDRTEIFDRLSDAKRAAKLVLGAGLQAMCEETAREAMHDAQRVH